MKQRKVKTYRIYDMNIIEILREFNDAVHQGSYRKMDYVLWKSLNTTQDLEIFWKIIFFPNGGIQLQVFNKNENSNVAPPIYEIWFNQDDQGFGSFLTYKFNEEYKNEKENEMMKGFNFDFGPCSGDRIRISMYGIAIQNTAGTWVSYNPADGTIIDVDVFSFEDAAKYMYKMPVAIKDIAVGDVIVHNRVPVFVTDVTDGKITVTDIRAGERKEVLPTTNMFGFNFVTKIVSLFNAVGNAPTPEQPFGNMLPFLMLNGTDGKDIDPMMMMLMVQNQGGDTASFLNNPMMLYCLMKNEANDILPLMMLMNQK